MIDVSNVPIVLATSIISVLSIAINGLKTGMLTEAFVQVRPCIVCDATCPILSPVTKASHLLNLPTSSAILIMKRLEIIVIASSLQFTPTAFCISNKLTL